VYRAFNRKLFEYLSDWSFQRFIVYQHRGKFFSLSSVSYFIQNFRCINTDNCSRNLRPFFRPYLAWNRWGGDFHRTDFVKIHFVFLNFAHVILLLVKNGQKSSSSSSSSCSWSVGRVSCSLILKMKLVPPSLPWSSYVPSSFVSILCTCCSHFFLYCFISLLCSVLPFFPPNTLILFFI
jgi:hypothetical protein